ncbi:MAG: HAD-IIB family hydrolase [Hyphomicrobiales bacterium]|nr:HAD-IIB family hydrolase [Hyphomicrobiales bacterium]MBV8664742.1 HAD-IIB family hydrolase [Hyphomicrobiales bacterium]
MYITCLATDYDGTLAHDGAVEDATVQALIELKTSGRKLILLTGRELPDLARAFARLDLFDRIVAENGALLFDPATKKETPLAPEPRRDFVDRLKTKGVAPLSVGKSIVATWEPNETSVLEATRELGLELQIVFNKGAVMVLPAGVNKASGLKAALADLGFSAHNVVAVGDAENDHAFMQESGFAVAVANALAAIKDEADLVTRGARGAGVVELIGLLIERDAEAFAPAKEHRAVEIGVRRDGRPLIVHPYRQAILVAGLSGGGKSTLATALIERIVALGFQAVVVDPEGDYAGLRSAVALGDATAPPHLSEILKVIERPETNLVINMLAAPPADRPAAFTRYASAIGDFRARLGRPHWILVDEAHHVLPAERDAGAAALPPNLPTAVFVTVDPEALARNALDQVDTLFAVGTKPAETIEAFCRGLAIPAPAIEQVKLKPGEALVWQKRSGQPPEIVTLHPPAEKSGRHTRKYAKGELGEDKSFYFRGPKNALNLRAQNLTIFLQIADGVDDETWTHHAKRHDVSHWISEAIKDEELAAEARAAEDEADPKNSRRLVREAIERRYTAPAEGTHAGHGGVAE